MTESKLFADTLTRREAKLRILEDKVISQTDSIYRRNMQARRAIEDIAIEKAAQQEVWDE
ncbi:hypothetical protein L4D77_24290 [Photobacterium frigidiphilum]|uniref:hypothetical protein n=1 Tax=Photobacterium frigidiphilum TaxID=264736 RepID=UPI003D0F6FC8